MWDRNELRKSMVSLNSDEPEMDPQQKSLELQSLMSKIQELLKSSESASHEWEANISSTLEQLSQSKHETVWCRDTLFKVMTGDASIKTSFFNAWRI